VLSAGPRPPRSRRELSLLTDPHAPEAVALGRPADGVLAEVTDLQDRLDAEAGEAAGAVGYLRPPSTLRLRRRRRASHSDSVSAIHSAVGWRAPGRRR